MEKLAFSGKFLSENLELFPFVEDSVIKGQKSILFFDKGKTGCGGTTLAIKTALLQSMHVVILMPSVSSVVSKQDQEEFKNNSEIQFLYGSTKKVIMGMPKVICATYDKLKIITKSLGKLTQKYMLLIDEYHTLVRDANYRSIMLELVHDWNQWYSVTLMSATPDNTLEEAISKIYKGWYIQKLK